MEQRGTSSLQRRRLSLSLRVTIWLVVAAIFPLLITLTISELLTRPDLIDKANTQMASDAKTRVQLIDTYIHERILDTETITQVPSVQSFMALPLQTQKLDPTLYMSQLQHADYSLAAGIFRDKNYTTWALFNPQGQLLLAYPQHTVQPHGQYIIPPEYLKAIAQATAPIISDVYYNTTSKQATVDLYAPVITTQPKAYLGFIRASLTLANIWSIVQDDKGNNGDGSYAFILDENGIYVADTDSSQLFKSVAPLSASVEQRVQKEALYGSTGTIPVITNTAFDNVLHTSTQTALFTTQPSGSKEQYQVAVRALTNIPWHYFVLSPVNTVTAVANQQLLITGGMALAVSLLIVIIGLLVGTRLGRPILFSVESLLQSSEALTRLATKQQDAASEQAWVVDSSQVGLQSVKYYAGAIEVAARELNKAGTSMAQHWGQLNPYEDRQVIDQIVKTAQYIESAAQYQDASIQKLATALKVATQVTEQLVSGTTSATEAATQLEHVVEQLRTVVGK
jgi:methyl-accepting chemotaxis protein